MNKYFIEEAIKSAKDSGPDLPIGAVIVCNGEILAVAHNMKEVNGDVTMHAEMLVIREAQKKLGTSVLKDCDLYVTLEPCPMCMWAIILSRISNLYFGAYDLMYGAAGSKLNLTNILNSKLKVVGGIEEEKCALMLKDFFKDLR